MSKRSKSRCVYLLPSVREDGSDTRYRALLKQKKKKKEEVKWRQVQTVDGSQLGDSEMPSCSPFFFLLFLLLSFFPPFFFLLRDGWTAQRAGRRRRAPRQMPGLCCHASGAGWATSRPTATTRTWGTGSGCPRPVHRRERERERERKEVKERKEDSGGGKY